MSDSSSDRSTLSGLDLKQAFQGAARCLERQRDAINALNVFPVPDGDTGTNMLLTMRSVNEESDRTEDIGADSVAKAMANGALLGARGNSGVILSQFFNGLALGLRDKERFDGVDLARAFRAASEAAYKSVSKPVDGTMLSVIRDMSEAAESQCASSAPIDLWGVALEAAIESLYRTPEQLPVLRRAGVVDAGGHGVVTLMEGAWHALSGRDVEDVELTLAAPVTGVVASVDEDFLEATEEETYGFCTQFLLQGDSLDVDDIRDSLASMAMSTVVVGDEATVKVHVHTEEPDKIVAYAETLGSVSQLSMDNMDAQHTDFLAMHRAASGTVDGTAVVAVALGDGLADVLRELGCAKVVAGGQTMNPSARELLEAACEAGAKDVILLPNNKNIIPVARQVAALAEESPETYKGVRVRVVESRSVPQGVAAMVCYNPEDSPDDNVEAMDEGANSVRTIEVTTAVRDVALEGIDVAEGQCIGLLDGDLVFAGDGIVAALIDLVGKCDPEDGSLLTLYWGEAVEEADADAVAQLIGDAYPDLELELVWGGQPHYPYVASLE